MKVQKKGKQMASSKVLKHTPAAAAAVSTAGDPSAQSPFSCSQTSLQEQPRASGLSNHCMVHAKPGLGQDPAPPMNGIEDDGGGSRVKKKRKKKEKEEPGGGAAAKGTSQKEPRPKKKREPKEEGKEPKKDKQPKEAKKGKELKQQKEPKKTRKPRETKAPKEKRTATSPKTRGRKPSKDQGQTPVEKKKKGKRKSETPVDSLDSDENISLAGHIPSAEETTDSTDGQKRRSGRQVKRRKYNEDLDFKVVDDDGETIAVLGTGRIPALPSSTLAWQSEEPPEDEANIIERILSSRWVNYETSPGEPILEAEEFYVKYRNFSYLHCKWATLEELEKDPRISQKIKRFRNKQAQMKHIFTEPDEDLFNPDYIEVDRVLEVAHTKDTETGEEVTHYLVKWCSLSYEESTWELQEDVDPGKIKEFEDIQKIPAIKHMERPAADTWQKLERSRDYRNANELREYQLEGMNWLLFNWYNRKNCILADEMGLGKTIQSITFLYEIFLLGIRGPFLIIAPLSTITNWEREFRTWTEMNAIVYHGSQISRQMIQQYEMLYKDEQANPFPGLFKFHGVITTFEMILADCPELKKIHWRCVVIDEAHRLKNRNCKLLEGLKLMNLEHKVLLTGTPLQNSVEELFSLLNFLEPVQFPSESTFLDEFGDLKTEEQVKKLQALLKPMMLRRLKDDVEKNLAPKEETIIEVELTNIQKKYYRAILEKNFTFLAKGANQHNMPNLINTMMELRKCCNHPYLITGAEEKILEDFRKNHSPEAWDFQLQAMIQAAGKLVLINKLLPKLIAGGHKVLIFSQMVRCLDILEDYLIQRRYTYERIDGRVRGNLRQAAIDRFCKVDSDRFVFLLCTRAGGLGINLTAADTCIIFDSDWNPQNDLQAQARCHRIGQSKAVKVYRLITRNSYEREMFDKASLKLGLDKAVLQDINKKGSTNGVQQLSKMEVEDLLRKGAYGALMDEEDEGSKFCEEDIDQILQRRTRTITIQTEGKGSTFAKASFVSSGNRTDISLDDPNFWQKWAKIAELELDSKDEKESLVIDTPRVRKQTRHYNSFEDDELMEFSELESDSEDRPSRTRRLNERHRRYMRAECFRVEKNLLIFGWGRWKDILTHGRFKWHLVEKDMELICRALLVYCVKHYKGDEKIKSFIWDLITPTKDGHSQDLQNHSGLSAPVPRGRKGKKLKNPMSLPEIKSADWLVSCNPEILLHDDSYKKHLKQHCNKVLLRVRMLYYLKAEVLGEAAVKALEGIHSRDLDVLLPDIDYLEIPVEWWDGDADKSLLLGVHKHGYERYHAMRTDPKLCFLERVGMPDEMEQGVADVLSERIDTSKEDDLVNKEAVERDKDLAEEEAAVCNEAKDKVENVTAAPDCSDQDRPMWPVASSLTARLRRLITVYQRFNRKELIRSEFLVPDGHGTWHLSEEMRRRVVEPDPLFLEMQNRWTRREQADFYRTVSSFGVVFDPEKKCFDWTQFRMFARLERKTDQSLERYFHSFVAMCRCACRLPPRKDEGPLDQPVFVEPITEERAARTLYRMELLRKVREQVLRHPELASRLQLCQPSLYLPVWWECGKHDRDLLIGAAKHGLSRTDYYILNDPQLYFLEAHRNYVQKENKRHPGHAPARCSLYEASVSQCASPVPYPGTHHAMEAAGSIMDPCAGEVGPGSKNVFMEDSMNLASLHHDETLGAGNTLHGKALKDSSNVFPFNTDTGGQSMLNTYSVQADAQAVAGKLHADPLGNEQSHCEADLMVPSGGLDEIQTQWDSTEHSNAADIFNESGAILGAQTLESEFLDSAQPAEERAESSLPDCMTLPSLNSQGNSMELLPSSFMLFKEITGPGNAQDEPEVPGICVDHCAPDCVPPVTVTDLKMNHDCEDSVQENIGEPEEKLSDSDVTQSAPSLCDGSESVNLEFEKDDLSHDDQSNVEEPEEGQREAGQGCVCDVGDENTLSSQTYEGTDQASPAFSVLEAPPASSGTESVGELRAEEYSEDQHFTDDKPIKSEAGAGLIAPRQGEGGMFVGALNEEKPQPTAVPLESCEEDAKYSAHAARFEIQEGLLQDTREPTIAQLLQEKALYSFSEWPKDRVIINRIDNICHAILKGKWPSSSQQFDSPSSVSAQSCASSIAHRNNFLSARVPATQSLSFSIGAGVPQLAKDGLMSMPFMRDPGRSRRGFEFESEAGSKQGRMEKIPVVLNGWQEAAMDLSKAGDLSVGGSPKLASVGPLQSSLGLDMAGILQAGLIHPVTGQIVNGNLRRDDAVMRRRRGRRKNVEGVDLRFAKNRSLQNQEQNGQEGPGLPCSGPVRSDRRNPATQTQQAQSVVMEREVANKSLLEWLRQNPNYTMEMPAFSHNVGILHGFAERPKQRRHRCKDPSKLDVNSLTGEERVPVVHKGTGRRLGGAMAPAIKELSRWLDANAEYAVAPDWAEIVKHSGFLPEDKFSRILTEPVFRDPGTRRRGRRPRSEVVKAAGSIPDSPSTMGPLFMNGLISGMDLVSLQNLRNMQGIPLTGLMGFPHGFTTALPAGEEGKGGLNMLPMMLHGMAAVQPHMFSVSGLLNPAATAATSSTTVTSSSTSPSSCGAEKDPADAPKGEELEERQSATSTSSHPEPTVSASGPLAFNPFLIPGVSHGLLYPHMFLPHSVSMALPGVQQASPSEESPKSKKRKVKEDEATSQTETPPETQNPTSTEQEPPPPPAGDCAEQTAEEGEGLL
ncbi:hypothetical protein AOXY_G23730 [Acipenser oxyrinchus oxyrinchus]|uniref:DNA helicase n=1 Tax=Acipenser oxyrinchus oxyrinchus TaxID=40147 RepID=A0AAD8FUB3_ACIOX|nr:hypothetical protein AOXY_G23730 [Acipenser oxyrinchus oxyrinchus]